MGAQPIIVGKAIDGHAIDGDCLSCLICRYGDHRLARVAPRQPAQASAFAGWAEPDLSIADKGHVSVDLAVGGLQELQQTSKNRLGLLILGCRSEGLDFFDKNR